MTDMWTRELLAVAEAVVGDAERVFRSSIGAEPMITKGAGDFATETDMKIEQRVRETLAERTGLPVFGEEGGGSLDEDTFFGGQPHVFHHCEPAALRHAGGGSDFPSHVG